MRPSKAGSKDLPLSDGGRIAKGIVDVWDVLKADLDVDLLRDRQSVFNLDAKVSHGAFQLGVAEQELNRTDVARAPVDQRRLFGASPQCGS